MSFQSALESFVTKLNDSLEDPLDGQFLDLIREKATEVFEPCFQQTGQSAGAPVKVKAKKPPNAYNCFVKEYADKHPGTANIMQVVSPIWKGMDEKARAPYVEMAQKLKAAAAANPTPAAPAQAAGAAAPATPKKKRGKTGYNVYVAEHRTGENTMKQVGEMWKALSEAERKVYNDKAKAINEGTA